VDRGQRIATVLFFVVVGLVMMGSVFSGIVKSVPKRVEELYPLTGQQSLATGRLRTYISPEAPLPTAEKLREKLGRPNEMTDLEQWKSDPTRPILILYDDYVISVEDLGDNRAKVEVTSHETAYNRHHTHFIHYWGPTVRRGSIFNWGGPGRVQDGGIGGLGGK
jgi:hypothetical protein